jgi:hypothetical protein
LINISWELAWQYFLNTFINPQIQLPEIIDEESLKSAIWNICCEYGKVKRNKYLYY